MNFSSTADAATVNLGGVCMFLAGGKSNLSNGPRTLPRNLPG